MIEIFTSGFFVGRPHEIGGGGAIILSDGQEVGRVKEAFLGDQLTSSIAAELDVLMHALELARQQGEGGEEVTVRTGYASLADLCCGRISRTTPDIQERVHRLSEIAQAFSGVRAIVSPSWVTARPHDLALRAVLDRFRQKAKEGETPGNA